MENGPYVSLNNFYARFIRVFLPEEPREIFIFFYRNYFFWVVFEDRIGEHSFSGADLKNNVMWNDAGDIRYFFSD